MVSFKEYLWARIRKPMWMSWLALIVLSVCTYSIVVTFIKAKQLNSSLQVAAYTVTQAIQAGDWSLALGHLQALEKAGPVFEITLRSTDASQNVSGPFGEHPIGLGTFCSEQASEESWVLRGCMRVFSLTELYTLGLFVIFAFAAFSISFRLFRSKSLSFIEKISDELEEMQTGSSVDHAEEPIAEINSIRSHILDLRSKAEQNSRTKAFAELSVQVAHDIRSPLAALDMAVKGASVLPESDRVLVRTAVSRISDIANNLISQYSPEINSESHPVNATAQKHLLSSLIDSVISEKRIQYRSRLGIEISTKTDSSTYGLFVEVDAIEFKRVLSNLINNSCEAIDDSGNIVVEASLEGPWVEVSVIDSGKGISAEHLPRLMTRGASFGKINGTGLGLFHAKESVTSWGGSIELQSVEMAGTTVTIKLPRVESPGWFVRELSVPSASTVAILDDDPSIHQVWDGRFSNLGSMIKVVHFSTTKQFVEWYRTSGNTGEALYLIDYELIGSDDTGLELIEKLGIIDHSILVTSRYEESPVKEKCRELNVKLIPKSMAGFVPIVLHGTDTVLIDDDPIIHQVWKKAAESAGKSFSGFTSVDSFIEASDSFDPRTPIYLDSNLGNGARGEVLASKIHARGFTSIYLVTGFSRKDFKPTPEISGVLDKNPPWRLKI